MYKKGFSLLELLVVVAIIALVGTLAAVAVNSARSRERDATRLSHLRQMQAALEDFFNENNMYPSGLGLPLGDGSLSACLAVRGFTGDCEGASDILVRVVPAAIGYGLEKIVICGDPPRSAYCYSQSGAGVGYTLEFELENGLEAALLAAGPNCATPDGIKPGSCSN